MELSGDPWRCQEKCGILSRWDSLGKVQECIKEGAVRNYVHLGY